eukprot:1111093-Prorocentrum_minimum.AAC.1
MNEPNKRCARPSSWKPRAFDAVSSDATRRTLERDYSVLRAGQRVGKSTTTHATRWSGGKRVR